MTIDERLDALVESLRARRAGRETTRGKVAEKTKAIYRIQVGDKYTEFDDPINFSLTIQQLLGGYGKTIKGPVAPEDIRLSLRSAPADPPEPEWKTVE